MQRPKLIFGCELCGLSRQQLLTDEKVIKTLTEMRAGVCLDLPILSAGCAPIVHLLTDANVEVYARLLLPKEQGYFPNRNNSSLVTQKYQAFHQWSQQYSIKWTGVCLDFEPDLLEYQHSMRFPPFYQLLKFVQRCFEEKQTRQARAVYNSLIRQMKQDGYRVVTFQMPYIMDERRAGSTFLQKTLGIMDVRGDCEVLKLMSNSQPPFGKGLSGSYGPVVQAIAVGNTSCSSVFQQHMLPLDWEELTCDLLSANQFTDTLFILNLEGCQKQDFLRQLKNFNWNQPGASSGKETKHVNNIRKLLQAFLWSTSHPAAIFAAGAGLITMTISVKRLIQPKTPSH